MEGRPYFLWLWSDDDRVTEDELRDWPQLERHPGRRRAFWQFTLDGWRKLGLIS